MRAHPAPRARHSGVELQPRPARGKGGVTVALAPAAQRRAAGARSRAPSPPEGRELRAFHADAFMFATGIECSYPVIASRGGGITRQDQLEKCGHYRHWREDLRLVAEDI